VPREPGVYAWYFRETPPDVPTEGCRQAFGATLLYAGISPKKRPSTQNLRSRIRYHYTGNAEGSTLRLTLGCLLERRLGICLCRVGSGKRRTFADGEDRLSEWIAHNALVIWHPIAEWIEVWARVVDRAGDRSGETPGRGLVPPPMSASRTCPRVRVFS